MLEIKLFPCPACGGEGQFYQSLKAGHYIPCLQCGLRGPLEQTPYEAADAWNSLPRAMVWRKDIPDVKFYSNPDDIFFAEIEGTAVIIYASEMADTLEQPGLVSRWAGPIPTPKEPTP